jgi:hypothetical protein
MLNKTEYVRDPVHYADLLNDHRINVQRVEIIGPKLAMITYSPKKTFVKEHPETSVTISLYTTSAARLRLLESKEKVVCHPDALILYHDTYIFHHL